jgi:hypothetical protein
MNGIVYIDFDFILHPFLSTIKDACNLSNATKGFLVASDACNQKVVAYTNHIY